MNDVMTATVFEHDGVLAVDLPADFHAPNGQVRITRDGGGVRIEPVTIAAPAATPTPDSELALAALLETIREVRAQAAADPKPLTRIGRKLSAEERAVMFAKMQAFADGAFMEEGREQPPMPNDDEHSFD